MLTCHLLAMLLLAVITDAAPSRFHHHQKTDDDDDDATLNALIKKATELLKNKANILLKNSKSNIDDEGLNVEQQEGASYIETRQGEEHNKVEIPTPPDENEVDASMANIQALLLRDGEYDEELLRTMVQTVEKTGLPLSEILNSVPGSLVRQLTAPQVRSGFAKLQAWEKGIVPYYFSYRTDARWVEGVRTAMDLLEDNSCVDFVPYSASVHEQYGLSHSTYLNFTHTSGGCWSYVGKAMRRSQPINPCGLAGIGTTTHELLHALGSRHEQSRSDRDRYIQVVFPHIMAGQEGNFRKGHTLNSVPYDYGSVMHYSLRGFSSGTENSLSVYDEHLEFLAGTRGSIGFYDLMDVNRNYRCAETVCPGFSITCKNDGYVGVVQGACKCVCPFGLTGADCGTVRGKCTGVNNNHVVLSTADRTEDILSPNYPRFYSNNQECFWLIESPPDTFIQVKFIEIDIEKGRTKCWDSLEIRHNIIGQPGERYCGDYSHASRVSNTNLVLLVFRSDSSIVQHGFRISANLIEPSQLAFNLSDRGLTYRGVISETQNYKRCASWIHATKCTINPTTYPDAGLGDHTYCRNPNQAERPWCYTNADTCDVDLCDVSQLNGCYDKRADCQAQKDSNSRFCNTLEGFEQCHYTCEHCQSMISTGPTEEAPAECIVNRGTDYRGRIATTADGDRCGRWDIKARGYTPAVNPDNYPDETIADAANYCRNPDNDYRPWCYTLNPQIMWAYCDIPTCPTS